MSDVFFAYGLIDPRTDQLRYVGLSKNPNRRVSEHLYCRGESDRSNWMRGLRSVSLRPEIIIFEEVFDDLETVEQFWIGYFKMVGADLVNMTIGGKGVKGLSKKASAKQGEANKRRIYTPELLETMSAAAKKTYREKPELLKNLSKIHKGKIVSEETREKLRIKMLAREPMAQWVKDKIREKALARGPTPQWVKDKIAATIRARKEKQRG